MMRLPIIDAHIHVDLYENDEQIKLLESLPDHQVTGLIAVSMDLTSSKKNLLLSRHNSRLYPAFGFHPEQLLPKEEEIDALCNWMMSHQEEMIAVGEVGLPYYLRREKDKSRLLYGDYLNLLDRFIRLAKKLDKPVILHAVYDDAPIVCDLLEKHSITHAHFHWFKGDKVTTERMAANGYFISVTPDVLYEPEIQTLIRHYPFEQIMVETDGPWPFEGPFQSVMTHPAMIHESISQIAAIKRLPVEEVYSLLLQNTKGFYRI